MSNAPQSDFALRQKIGIFVFVALCGLPALEMNGFGFGIPFELKTALGCAAVGGVLGGWLICPRPLLAGVLGGFIAGTLGLLAVAFYTQHREKVLNMELVAVQGVASLPGLALGIFLKKMSGKESETIPRPDAGSDTPQPGK